jgi:integrase
MTEDNVSVPIATEEARDRLTDRQLLDFESERKLFLDWLNNFGKNPQKANGYGVYTVRDTMYRSDRFYRWMWSEEGKYTLNLTIDHANEYMKHQARREVSADAKASTQRAVKRLYKWLHAERNLPEWDPEITYSNSSLNHPKDFLTREERGEIREAAMEYGAIPGYNDLDPDERDRWRIHLSQRFEIPKKDVMPEHWDRANGWKIPTIVWTSLDAGLRPVEVGRFSTDWLNLHNQRLLIPKEDSSKNTENWIVPIRERTTKALKQWVAERKLYDSYDGEDRLWLTREGTPYSASSLRYMMRRLFDIAGIPKENRTVSWYSIRHSTGTYMTREEDLKAAMSQLRHKSPMTTMRYDQAPEGDRRKALDRMD